MSIDVKTQIPHQKSTTMWSQPTTQEQKTYYSKHSPKRRVYGIFMTLLQCGHGFLAFAAWNAIFFWALAKVPTLLPLVPFLAALCLLTFHMLFRVTWQTYWYDRLDDDPNTDSSFLIPVGIIALLLFTEVEGAKKYLKSQVETPKVVATSIVDSAHTNLISALDQQYRSDVTAIRDLYGEKEKAATMAIDRQIKNLRSQRAGDNRKAINAQIAALQGQRDAALSPILQAKSTELEKAMQASNQRKGSEKARRDQAIATIDQHNRSETERYDTDLNSVNGYAWMISAILLALIAALGYARVRINVKSGILPLRNYTVLDAHGSVFERLSTAFSDAFNRRSLQMAVWIHKELSPKKAISSFDGTIVSKPGTYNTPAGFFPPAHTKTIEQAASEVLLKINSNPHIRLSEEDILNEIQRSLSSNGNYPTMPLSGKTMATATNRASDVAPTPSREIDLSPVTLEQYFSNLPNISVSQPQHPVSQINQIEPDTSVISPNELLRWYLQELRREPSNFQNKHANPATVVARIHNKLRRLDAALNSISPAPTLIVVDELCRYLGDTIGPLLETKGQPFASMDELILKLQSKQIITETA